MKLLFRYLPLFVFCSLTAFVGGVYFVTTRTAPAEHPLTGRQIADDDRGLNV